MNKQEIRKWAKEVRKTLPVETLSKKFVEKIKTSNEYLNAKNIMLFYPKENEINLLELTKDFSRNFYLPKINGDSMLCCLFDNKYSGADCYLPGQLRLSGGCVQRAR